MSDKLYSPTIAYCLVQDDDCHWYLIPASSRAQFAILNEDPELCEELNEDFGDYRIDGPHRLVFYKPKIK